MNSKLARSLHREAWLTFGILGNALHEAELKYYSKQGQHDPAKAAQVVRYRRIVGKTRQRIHRRADLHRRFKDPDELGSVPELLRDEQRAIIALGDLHWKGEGEESTASVPGGYYHIIISGALTSKPGYKPVFTQWNPWGKAVLEYGLSIHYSSEAEAKKAAHHHAATGKWPEYYIRG